MRCNSFYPDVQFTESNGKECSKCKYGIFPVHESHLRLRSLHVVSFCFVASCRAETWGYVHMYANSNYRPPKIDRKPSRRRARRFRFFLSFTPVSLVLLTATTENHGCHFAWMNGRISKTNLTTESFKLRTSERDVQEFLPTVITYLTERSPWSFKTITAATATVVGRHPIYLNLQQRIEHC